MISRIAQKVLDFEAQKNMSECGLLTLNSKAEKNKWKPSLPLKSQARKTVQMLVKQDDCLTYFDSC